MTRDTRQLLDTLVGRSHRDMWLALALDALTPALWSAAVMALVLLLVQHFLFQLQGAIAVAATLLILGTVMALRLIRHAPTRTSAAIRADRLAGANSLLLSALEVPEKNGVGALLQQRAAAQLGLWQRKIAKARPKAPVKTWLPVGALLVLAALYGLSANTVGTADNVTMESGENPAGLAVLVSELDRAETAAAESDPRTSSKARGNKGPGQPQQDGIDNNTRADEMPASLTASAQPTGAKEATTLTAAGIATTPTSHGPMDPTTRDSQGPEQRSAQAAGGHRESAARSARLETRQLAIELSSAGDGATDAEGAATLRPSEHNTVVPRTLSGQVAVPPSGNLMSAALHPRERHMIARYMTLKNDKESP